MVPCRESGLWRYRWIRCHVGVEYRLDSVSMGVGTLRTIRWTCHARPAPYCTICTIIRHKGRQMNTKRKEKNIQAERLTKNNLRYKLIRGKHIQWTRLQNTFHLSLSLYTVCLYVCLLGRVWRHNTLKLFFSSQGSAPDPTGELITIPSPSSRLRRENPDSAHRYSPFNTRRLRYLDLGAFLGGITPKYFSIEPRFKIGYIDFGTTVTIFQKAPNNSCMATIGCNEVAWL